MGKRSNFERVERDFYPTPKEAVVPLVRHLPPKGFTYEEPCAGAGDLVNALSELAPKADLVGAYDIQPRHICVRPGDALTTKAKATTDFYITNPPWDRKLLHPIIENLSQQRPTWLLFDANWMFTKQAVPYLSFCHKIVTIGRVKWIKDSKHTGKDDSCWYLFANIQAPTQFFGRQT